jgi:REP element-mobilizing transposase RayT
MFLLKPSKEVNQIIGSSLGRALESAPVELHGATCNINHMGMVFSIGKGQTDNASKFIKHFAQLCSRELNRHYGLEGHFWACRARVEEITSDKKAEKVLGYDACNPVKDGLVESYRHWKGFSTTEALLHGKILRFKYIKRTAWWGKGGAYSNIPQKEFERITEVNLTLLPSWRRLRESQRQTRYRHILRNQEGLAERDRKAEGLRVMGKERINRINPFDKPRNPRKRTPQPLCHADNIRDYNAYKKAYQEVANAHKEASTAFRKGAFDVEFPGGTFRPPVVTVCNAQCIFLSSQSP